MKRRIFALMGLTTISQALAKAATRLQVRQLAMTPPPVGGTSLVTVNSDGSVGQLLIGAGLIIEAGTINARLAMQRLTLIPLTGREKTYNAPPTALVFLNGLLQKEGEDYTRNTDQTITFVGFYRATDLTDVTAIYWS